MYAAERRQTPQQSPVQGRAQVYPSAEGRSRASSYSNMPHSPNHYPPPSPSTRPTSSYYDPTREGSAQVGSLDVTRLHATTPSETMLTHQDRLGQPSIAFNLLHPTPTVSRQTNRHMGVGRLAKHHRLDLTTHIRLPSKSLDRLRCTTSHRTAPGRVRVYRKSGNVLPQNQRRLARQTRCQ